MVFLLPVHEAAHAWTACRLGDSTAKNMGRLTLNPIKHLDPLGSILLLLMGFGWAKPVPVDPRNFKKPKTGMGLTALAGPLSNLIFALVLTALVRLMLIFSGSLASLPDIVIYYILNILIGMAYVSVSLAVFNLIPVPPLDGSKIFALILPDRLYYKMLIYERYISIAVFLLMFTGVLGKPIAFLTERIFNLMLFPYKFFS
jgi:Zn-dependent protease